MRSSDVDRPAAIVAVTVLGVVGSIVFLLLPLLVGAFTEELGLDPRQVGYLASADMVGMFVAAAVATAWVRRTDWRFAAACGTALLVVCHLLSAFVDGWVNLLAVRVGAGFAGGSLMSIALTSLGDARNSDRLFALFISGQLGLGALALWRMPELLASYGLRGVFWALAALTALTAVTIPVIPRAGRLESSPEGSDARIPSMTPGVLALLACLAFNTGIMAVWAYVERIGDAVGLEAEAIGGALGASLLAALFGSLLAAAVGDRFGRTVPIGAALALQLVALALLWSGPSVFVYGVAVMLFAFCWNLPVAFQLATTVAVDPSGRLVVLFLSAVKLGYAIGPAIVGLLVASMGLRAPLLLGAVCFAASGAIFLPLTRLAARPVEVP